MNPRTPGRPRWTPLNLILLAVVGLLALESQLHLTPLGGKAALVTIVLVTYGLMARWVTANAAALDEDVTAAEGPQAVRPTPTAAPVPQRREDQRVGGTASADR